MAGAENLLFAVNERVLTARDKCPGSGSVSGAIKGEIGCNYSERNWLNHSSLEIYVEMFYNSTLNEEDSQLSTHLRVSPSSVNRIS